MASEEHIRAFLALPLASCFGEEVKPLLEHLKRKFPQVRWVSPQGIHVTLHFFGAITRREIDRISEIIQKKTQGREAVEVHLEGLGGFPTLLRPRVIWIGLKGEIAKLQPLQEELEGGFKNAGYPCEERVFKPHVTLGRVKDKAVSPNIDPRCFSRTATKKITELVLYQSNLTSQSPRYEALKTYPLAAS